MFVCSHVCNPSVPGYAVSRSNSMPQTAMHVPDFAEQPGLSPLSEKAATTNLSSLVQDSVLAAHARYMKDQPLNSLSFSSIVFEKLDCRGADVWLCGVGIDGYCENRETIVPNLVTVFSLLNGKILSPVVTPFTQAVDSERQRLGALKIDWHIYGLLIICAWVVGCLTGMFVKKVYGKLVERSRWRKVSRGRG